MSTICFSADWHVSNFGASREGALTARGQDVLRVISRMYDLADQYGADVHVGLGDIFDLDKPPPGLLRHLQTVVSRCPTWLLVGNHDQTSADPEHHALAPMRPCASVVEDIEVFQHGKCAIALVGFRQRDQVIDKVKDIVWPEGCRVLGVHLGISDNRTPVFLQDTKDSIHVDRLVELAHENSIEFVFAGNWHNPDQWDIEGVEIWQIGGLSPHVFGERWDRDGRVILFDTNKKTTQELWVPGPRYVTLTGSPPWENLNVPADPLWLRYKIPAEDEQDARSHAAKYTDPAHTRIIIEPKEAQTTDLTIKVANARIAVLEKAHEEGGTPLVNYVQDCLTKVTER
ncbi:MAG: hypothetical protein E6R03_08470 [Hyphomicrobiaceae bacterium]|nr:MAG: hypothetical protein E6R03_08470 [Hyphomicrobiaceae bacterium]